MEQRRQKTSKLKIGIIAGVIFLITASIVATVLIILNNCIEKPGLDEVEMPAEVKEEPVVEYYSNLTGEVIARSGAQDNGMSYTAEEAKTIAEAKNKAPLLCVQIPNGNDGARPHAGLNEAKIVFEAIAEAGITRFAAIFQDPTGTAIGPIRSLRSYYLQWDTPFDCTIVHAGGEANALKEVASYKHLSESKTYMWRTSGHNLGGKFVGYKAPNNLFSDGNLLRKFNSDNNITESNPKVWPRLSYNDSAKQKESTELTDATSIKFYYSASGNYNPIYIYDTASNTYLRSYENGTKHEYYICTSKSQPKPQEDCGESHQVSPDVVIAIKVKEHLNQENHYREVIETTGSGDALIFQNGKVIEATWTKKSISDQIIFKDKSSTEISLAPGQTWISAIPDYNWGKIKYE